MAVDLQPTDEQTELVQTLHRFAAESLRPAARPCESARCTPPEIAQQIHDIGVSSPVAEEFGGGGELDPVTYCMVAEELAWGDPGIAYQVLGSGLAAIVIGAAGSAEQRSRYLPKFGGATPVPAFVAVGEKIAAGDLGALDTTIEGDKVAGEKYGVLNAATATVGVVVGRSGSGLGGVVLGRDFEIVKAEDKLGLESAPTWVVRFDSAGDALVPGPRLDTAVLWTKLLTGSVAVGCARASLEYASAYAVQREAFGKPIGAFQGVSFKIADMAIAVDSARLALWRAAWKLGTKAATVGDFAAAVGQALAAAVMCGDDGVQVLGGHGYIRDHPIEKWFRDAVTLSVLDAPDLIGDVLVTR